MLTKKDRLHMALQGKKTDRPPCICPGGMMNMVTQELQERTGIFLPAAHTDARMMADLAKAVVAEGCFENLGVPFCMTCEAEALGASVTLGNTIYEPHVTHYPLKSVEDMDILTPIDVTKGRTRVVLDAIRLLKEETLDLPIIGNLTGPVSTASSVMEPVIYYKELRKKPEASHAYMDFITDQLICMGLAEIRSGADIIAISDPSGTGEILGPKYFKDYAVTALNRMIDAFHEAGAQVIVHICGHMNYVYEEIALVRSDALSFDSAVSMKEARSHLKDRVLMGNISTYAIEFATPDRIHTLTRAAIKNGSNIISPACGLGMKSPLENVCAALSYLKEQEEEKCQN